MFPIRYATIQDAAGIAAIVHAMKELRTVTNQPVESTTATIAANLERALTTGTSAAYVAEDPRGKIVAYGVVHWTPFLFLPGGEAYITELFVHPDIAGQGIGSALLETMTKEARRRGCSRVSLLNGRDGESYQRSFYKERGWIERDRMANFILPLEQSLEKDER